MRQLVITQSITTRENKSFENYLTAIGKVDLLTAEEEVVLAKKIKQGDQSALEKLTKANLRFVVSVAKQYQNRGLSLGDLVSEGNLGLIKAAQRFDETRGFKFISYAVWWIRQSILQALAEMSRVVRLPLNKVSNISKINKAFSQLEQEFEREPTSKEIADILGDDEHDVQNVRYAAARHISVDNPLRQGEEGTLLDVISDPNAVQTDVTVEYTESLSKEIERSLSSLSGRHKDVIKLFYGIGTKNSMSLEDIGQKYNLTKERIRQIKIKALALLKMNTRSKRLKAYLGV